jgi:hypothetical protein
VEYVLERGGGPKEGDVAENRRGDGLILCCKIWRAEVSSSARGGSTKYRQEKTEQDAPRPSAVKSTEISKKSNPAAPFPLPALMALAQPCFFR